MSAVRSKNTKSELLLRKHLTSLGLRYRIHYPGLPGRPDIVFVSKKIVIFCDGDFWHGRNWAKEKAGWANRTRSAFWIKKIEGNITRDLSTNQNLRKAGWTVLRYWETDIKKDPSKIAGRILAAISQIRKV